MRLQDLPEISNPEPDIRDQTIYVTEGEKHKWDIFKHHHYMSHTLPRGCKFFVFYRKDQDQMIPIACLGMLLQIGKIPAKRVTRFVILPEYQGLGFSKRILDGISSYYMKHQFVTYIVTFHPRLGTMLSNSKDWLPSLNNQKSHTSSNTKVNDRECIRSGVKMFRFKYCPVSTPNDIIHIDILGDVTGTAKRKKLFNDGILEHIKQERNTHMRKLREDQEYEEKEKLLDSQMAPDVKRKPKKNKRSKENLQRLKELKERNERKITK